MKKLTTETKPLIDKRISGTVVIELVEGVLSKYEITSSYGDYTGVLNLRFIAVDILNVLRHPGENTEEELDWTKCIKCGTRLEHFEETKEIDCPKCREERRQALIKEFKHPCSECGDSGRVVKKHLEGVVDYPCPNCGKAE